MVEGCRGFLVRIAGIRIECSEERRWKLGQLSMLSAHCTVELAFRTPNLRIPDDISSDVYKATTGLTGLPAYYR
jgi:hypothetical protein